MNCIELLKKINEKNKEQVFLFDELGNNKITYNDLDVSATAIAGYLIDSGLKNGDRVSIILENSSMCVKIYFGCLYAGIAVVPINPSLNNNEIVSNQKYIYSVLDLFIREKIYLLVIIIKELKLTLIK